jgi:FAD-linked oxidoreductase
MTEHETEGAPQRAARSKRRANAWRNWSGGVSETSTLVAGPTSETAVKALIIGAAGSGLKIKSVGAGHSFNDIAATEGLRLHFDDYRGLVSVNSDTNVATFRAGTKLHELPKLLKPYGLALANQGDIDAQTISGAISTGTHGTGLGFSGLSGMVKSLRMVLADGSVVYCDERTHPDLFEFARIGLGALGVILEVGLQCVPAFRVAAAEDTMPLDEVLDSFVAQARTHDHVEFFWFPHAEQALVKTNRRLAPGEEPDESYAPQTALAKFVDEEVVQNWAHQLVVSLGSVAPGLVPKVNQFAAGMMGHRHYVDDSHGVFVSQRRVRFNEMEYAVPLEDGPEIVREIRRMIEARDWRISFPVEVRCAGADDVPLSTAYGRDSMYIAVHQYARESHVEYFGAIEEVLVAAGGRPHWGKLHTLGADDLRERYDRFDDFIALRGDVDPNRVFANQYLTRTLGE